jgi:2-pyrone-4,6-dicarboxylate lactonase
MVKVSGIDRIDSKPPYQQGIPFANYLVRNYTDRCVWGSDWPHPTETQKPDDAKLLDLITRWTESEAVIKQILVSNPAELYGFD